MRSVRRQEPFPLHRKAQQWLQRMLAHEGADLHIGFNLHRLFSEAGLAAARNELGGDELPSSGEVWRSLREFEHPFFKTPLPLWRIALPPLSAPELPGEVLIDAALSALLTCFICTLIATCVWKCQRNRTKKGHDKRRDKCHRHSVGQRYEFHTIYKTPRRDCRAQPAQDL